MNTNILNGIITVVAHDAGAANLIAGWCKKNNDIEVRTTLAGPAAEIWKETLGFTRPWSLKDALQGADLLLSGTSYKSDLEHNARVLSKGLEVHSVGVIDHWVNYPQRFTRQGLQVLPDEIWVTDSEASRIAAKYFSKNLIHIKPNDYLNDLVEKIISLEQEQSQKSLQVLYVLEPIRNWGTYNNPGEFQALDYFLNNSQLVGIDHDCKILLRPHPSDEMKKYDYWIASKKKWRLGIDTSTSLESAIAAADIVVGCETYALIVAAAAGKRVISCLPPHAPKCRLPSKDIIHLCDIQQNLNKVI